MIRNFIYVLSLFFILIIVGCGDDPSDIASGIVGDNVVLLQTSAKQTSAVNFKKVVEMGTSSKLLVGKTDNVEAKFLIQFRTPMLDSIKHFLKADSIQLLSNKFFFYPNYKFGDSTATLDFTAHKILTTWDAYTFTQDSLSPLRYDYQNILTNKSINNDTLHYLSIKNEVVKEWLLAEADSMFKINNGILVKSASLSNRMLGYQGFLSGSNNNPHIEIVYQKLGSYTDTLIYYSDQDVHVVEGNIPVTNSDELFIQSGLSVQGRFSLSLDSLPNNIAINYAKITLTIDTLKSKFGSNSVDDLVLYYVTDSTNNSIDLAANALLRRDKNKFTGDVTRIINRLYRDGNYGVLIRPAFYIEGVEKYIIKNHLAPLAGEAPKVEITFSKRK